MNRIEEIKEAIREGRCYTKVGTKRLKVAMLMDVDGATFASVDSPVDLAFRIKNLDELTIKN